MAANSNKFVTDSSFLLCFLLPDEKEIFVENLFNQFLENEVQFIAPILLPFEIFNALKTATLRHRITFKTSRTLGQKFLDLSIELQDVDYLAVQKIANKHELTFYDASYLYLAKIEKLPLLTMDSNLQKLA